MVRSKLVKQLTEKWGLSLTETGRRLGVSPPAIAKAINRLNKCKFN
jgi:predicted transcriptional regulator